MSEKEFEKTLKLPKYSLIFNGVKISKDIIVNKVMDHFINNYVYLWNLIVLYTVLYGEAYGMIDGIRNKKPFVQVSLIAPCITISVLGTVKSWFLFWNKDTLLQVVIKLKEMHPMFEDKETEEFKIVKESMKLLKYVQYMLLSIYVIVVTAFCFVPVILAEYNYHKTGIFEIVYPYEVKYSFDVYHTSLWPLVYVHQVWATAVVILGVFGSDTLFFALCVYINMHFHLLGLRFKNIVSPCKNETRKALAKAVVRHNELIDLVEQSDVLYSKSSLFNIVISSVLICLGAFNITDQRFGLYADADNPSLYYLSDAFDMIQVADETSIVFAFATFLIMCLSQTSMVCYFADLLMRSSVEINNWIYNCPWYEADEVSKKTILLIMMRSQKACRLTAWKFLVLNLGAFTTILSRAWSYFALLKTVYK